MLTSKRAKVVKQRVISCLIVPFLPRGVAGKATSMAMLQNVTKCYTFGGM